MVAARQGGRAEWEHLIKSHLRFVLRLLLHRNDIEELLPGIEDYFQEGVKGLIKTINSFYLSRHA